MKKVSGDFESDKGKVAFSNPIVEKILTPKRGKITKSKFAKQIISLLLSGCTPAEIERWLIERGEKISHQAIGKWAKNRIPAAYLIPRPLLNEKLKDIDFFVNESKSMQSLILIQEDRVKKSLDTEEKSPLPLPYTNKEIKLLAELYIQGLKLKQDLGLEEKIPIRLEVSGELNLSVKAALQRIQEREKKEKEAKS